MKKYESRKYWKGNSVRMWESFVHVLPWFAIEFSSTTMERWRGWKIVYVRLPLSRILFIFHRPRVAKFPQLRAVKSTKLVYDDAWILCAKCIGHSRSVAPQDCINNKSAVGDLSRYKRRSCFSTETPCMFIMFYVLVLVYIYTKCSWNKSAQSLNPLYLL